MCVALCVLNCEQIGENYVLKPAAVNSTTQTVPEKQSLCFEIQTYLRSEPDHDFFYKIVELEASFVSIKKILNSKFLSSSYEQNGEQWSCSPDLSDLLLFDFEPLKTQSSLPLWLKEFSPLPP